MGAAASVRMVYKDALGWFKQYIDTETYIDDFKAIDKHNENALSFADVRDWMVNNSKKDPCWGIFLTSGPVLAIAHKNACKHGDSSSSVCSSKVVDVTEFRTLLVHLFAVSILWSHFENADQWEDSGKDIGNRQLNFDAFKLACRTLASTNAKEELPDEQILSDFKMLDENQSQTIGFNEVCNFCCRYIDDSDAKKIMIPKFFGDKNNPSMIVDDLISGLAAGPKTYFETSSIEEKNHGMILALTNKVAGQKGALRLASSVEHQNNIRKKYSTIHALTAHPICCGFLMSFCENEHNSENLSFLRDINEYRELFRDDTGIWTKDWRDIDFAMNDVVTADTSTESLSLPPAEHTRVSWTPRTDLIAAQIAAETIFEKYLHENSPNQVCVSDCVAKKTAERMNLLHLYGPNIFDEASIDPMKTMERDVLPRFRASDSVERMVTCVASCEPPPPPIGLTVPAPETLLQLVSSSEPFTSMESFPVNLEEMLTSQQLYTQFTNYLLIAEDTKSKSANALKCVRKIDILEGLLTASCNQDPRDQATQIFRYFVAEKSAFEIVISYPERKRIMLSLADPKKGMFSAVRAAALDLLTSDFKAFTESDPCLRGKESESKSKKNQSQVPYRPSLIWHHT